MKLKYILILLLYLFYRLSRLLNMNLIHQPIPWYVGGPLIGLTVPLLLLLGNKQFGISSTLRDLCAVCIPSLGKSLNSNIKQNIWNLFFALGILIGGTINAIFLENPNPVAISPETINDLNAIGIQNSGGLIPNQIFNWENLMTIQGIIFMVLGGILVGFGTRYAGGCTSGHGIYGLATFSRGSLMAVIGFFIGGLIMTHLIFPLLF